MNPFNTFGLDVFTYLKHIGVQIKEKITGKTASGILLFWQNTGPKKPVNEPSPFDFVSYKPVALRTEKTHFRRGRGNENI